MDVCVKSTLAGRVCNWHSSPLLAFWHIDVTMRHQIAGVEQAANHTNRSLLPAVLAVVCLAQSNSLRVLLDCVHVQQFAVNLPAETADSKLIVYTVT